MSENTETQEPEVVPPPVEEGQADGSPLPDDQRPTDDKPAPEAEQVLELRQRLTEMGEDKKSSLAFIQRMLSDPKLGPAARAIMEGREPVEESGESEDEAFTRLAGENGPELKRLLEAREKRLRAEFGSALRPLARTTVAGVQAQAIVEAAEAAGLDGKIVKGAAFKAFQKQYESANSWMAGVKTENPEAMADLTVRAYMASQKRSPVPENRGAALERGGGGGARPAREGETEEFDPRASDAFNQIQAIYKKGKTPVPKR